MLHILEQEERDGQSRGNRKRVKIGDTEYAAVGGDSPVGMAAKKGHHGAATLIFSLSSLRLYWWMLESGADKEEKWP